MPSHCHGGMAERFNATVLKTVVAQVTLSSNLSPSAIRFGHETLFYPTECVLTHGLRPFHLRIECTEQVYESKCNYIHKESQIRLGFLFEKFLKK